MADKKEEEPDLVESNIINSTVDENIDFEETMSVSGGSKYLKKRT